MKKIFLITLSFLLMCGAVCFSANAEEASYSWFCKHVKDHAQPAVDPSLAFALDLDGYYADRSHTEMSDGDKVIYLTFDAGYENGNVEKILDVLKEEQVVAAFFILGNLITKNTELVKRMAMEGHTVCNHTVRHKDMTRFEADAFLSELRELETLYTEYTGGTLAPFYRPPEGKFDRENLITAASNGYKTVFWSFAYPDWDNQKQPDREGAKRTILENLHNGEVMLLHPTSSTNAAILSDVIKSIKAEGFRFGTLEELAYGRGER